MVTKKPSWCTFASDDSRHPVTLCSATCCRRGSACRYDCLCFLVLYLIPCNRLSHQMVLDNHRSPTGIRSNCQPVSVHIWPLGQHYLNSPWLFCILVRRLVQCLFSGSHRVDQRTTKSISAVRIRALRVSFNTLSVSWTTGRVLSLWKSAPIMPTASLYVRPSKNCH